MDAEAQPGAGIPTIQHVALRLAPSDLERAVRLWRLLGFEEVDPPVSLRGRSTWFEAGPSGARTQIHLLIDKAGRGGPERGLAGHVAVVVPRFEAALTALRRAGFAVEPRKPHWGSPRAFLEHPGGHTVELMQAPPAAAAEAG